MRTLSRRRCSRSTGTAAYTYLGLGDVVEVDYEDPKVRVRGVNRRLADQRIPSLAILSQPKRQKGKDTSDSLEIVQKRLAENLANVDQYRSLFLLLFRLRWKKFLLGQDRDIVIRACHQL